MDQVNKVIEDLDKMAEASPEFVKVCKNAGIPPGAALLGGGSVLILLGVWLKGYAILMALVSNLYPMWKSMLTLEDNKSEETNTWLCYWTVYAIVQLTQLFFGFIFDYIPYFSIVQLAFYIWLMAPQTNGARTLYQSVFRDLLKEHKGSLQKFFDSMEA